MNGNLEETFVMQWSDDDYYLMCSWLGEIRKKKVI